MTSNSEISEKLLPCPFCGSANVAQGASRGYISVWCFCGARGPEVEFPDDCIDPVTPIRECHAAWNRRAALARAEANAGEPVVTVNHVGWKWMPEVPTDEMMQAALYQSSHDAEYADVCQSYMDMWRVAPEPPTALTHPAQQPSGPMAPRDCKHEEGCEHPNSPIWLCDCPRPAPQPSRPVKVAQICLNHAADEANRVTDPVTKNNLRYWIEQAKSCLSALTAGKPEQAVPTHRHKTRGTEYMLIGIGRMQAKEWFEGSDRDDYWGGVSSIDMREVAIYRSVDDGSLWVRPREEFEGGRFKALPAAPTAGGGE